MIIERNLNSSYKNIITQQLNVYPFIGKYMCEVGDSRTAIIDKMFGNLVDMGIGIQEKKSDLEVENQNYIDANDEILETYWNDNIMEGVLDDDMQDEFERWMEGEGQENLIKIINEAKK